MVGDTDLISQVLLILAYRAKMAWEFQSCACDCRAFTHSRRLMLIAHIGDAMATSVRTQSGNCMR